MSPIVQLPDKPTPEWVAVREVAERCGISVQVCRTLLARAEIPIRKFGRLVKVRSADADRFVEEPGIVEREGREYETFDQVGRSRQAQSSASRSSAPA